jgi:hypothetical protein
MRTHLILSFLILVAPAAPAQDAPREAPRGWRWQLDEAPDTALQVWSMAPGWHATTERPGFWWDTTMVARGRFAVEAEFHLFPDAAASEFGLAIGAANLGKPNPSYLKFVIRRDGFYTVAIREPGNYHEIAGWKHTYFVNQPGIKEPARNLVRIQAEGSAVTFYVNGRRITYVDRSMTRVDGLVAIRLGAGINAHITYLKIVPLDS